MPLIKSSSPKAVGKNISKEQAAGKPHDQAIAIALSTQREAARGKRKAVLEDAYAKYVEENA